MQKIYKVELTYTIFDDGDKGLDVWFWRNRTDGGVKHSLYKSVTQSSLNRIIALENKGCLKATVDLYGNTPTIEVTLRAKG